MAKLYSKPNPKKQHLEPKKETIDFILNYSKALRIVHHQSIKFNSVIN